MSDTTHTEPEVVPAAEHVASTGRRAGGGRAGRQAARASSHAESVPYITRTLKPFEVLDDDGIALIERNACLLYTSDAADE